MVATVKLDIDTAQLKRLRTSHKKKADQALRALAEEGVTIVKLSMTESPASGRMYKRGSKYHTASSPGNAPRVDMGTLRASIKSERERELRYIVSDGVIYGVYLEFGTEKMAARPFMTPMIEELKKKIPIIFDNYLNK